MPACMPSAALADPLIATLSPRFFATHFPEDQAHLPENCTENSSEEPAEDAKYTRRRKASAPKLPFRTRSLFDERSELTEHKILGRT